MDTYVLYFLLALICFVIASPFVDAWIKKQLDKEMSDTPFKID